MIDNRHVFALRQIAEAVSTTRSCVKWFGEMIIRLPTALARRSREEQTEHFALALRDILYTHFYTMGRPILRGELAAIRSAVTAQNIAAALHLANPGAGRLEHGWHYLRSGRLPRTVVVERNRLAVTISSQVLIAGADPALLNPGDEATLRTPAGGMNVSPGYYVAHSDAELPYAEPLARFYLNVMPTAAPSLLHDLCGALNARGFAFDFKVASDLSAYHRTDVAVLYLPRAQAPAALPTVLKISSGPSVMRPVIPALTQQIAPGLAGADDPGGDESFGLHRCRIIATALVRDQLAVDGEARFSSICAAFAREGLSVELPHLGPGQPDIYALSLP